MKLYDTNLEAKENSTQLLAILIDPEKFETTNEFTQSYLSKIPSQTTHLFVGGSTDPDHNTEDVVKALKKAIDLPIILFPGNYNQVTPEADAILFLSLLSGNNAEYLIGQQRKAAQKIKASHLEVIPTGYVLIDGGNQSAIARVSDTKPIPQNDIETIVNTALAAQYLGKKVVYLEAGSGALNVVSTEIIRAVSLAIDIPIIVGGGIRKTSQMNDAYNAGATMVVIGTAFEEDSWNPQA